MKVETFFLLILSFNFWLAFCEDVKILTPKERITKKYSTSSKFYFAISLDDTYKIQSEGMITFKVADPNKIKVYSKVVTGDKEHLLEKMPTSDTQFELVQSEYENYLFLLYKYLFTEDDGWVAITVDVENTESTEQSFEIVLSSPKAPEKIMGGSFEMNVQLEDYIPKIYKYALNKREDKGFTYVFSSFSGLMTVFDETLVVQKDSSATQFIKNPNSSTSLIYSHTLPITSTESTFDILTFVFFGPAQTIIFEMDNTESEITTIATDKRPTPNIYPVEIENAFQPYHFIGFYEQTSDDTIFFEKIYGDGNIYFNDFISNSTIRYKEVLPDEKIGEEVINDFVFAETTVDIITIKCFTHCLFNIHFIKNDQLFNSTRKIGEMFYAMIGNGLFSEITVEKPFDNGNIEIIDINKKDALVKINEQDFQSLTRDSPIIRTNLPTEVIEDKMVLNFTTSSRETVLLMIKLTRSQTYTQVIESDGTFTIDGKYALFKMPKTKEYLTYSLELTKTGQGDAKLNYYMGKGVNDYIHIPEAPSVNSFSTFIFSFTNPYYNVLSIPKSEEFYYIAVVFSGENFGVSAKVTFIKRVELPQLAPLTTAKIEDQKTFQITQAETEEQKLFLVATKCKEYEVDIYLKFREIELTRHWIEKQFTKLIIEPKNYNMELEFRKGNQSEPFSPLMVYYQYATQQEIDAFALNDDFTISYQFGKNSNTSVFLTWKNPFSPKVKPISVSYHVFKTEYPDENSTFNICDCDADKAIYTVTAETSIVQSSIRLNRSIDNYIYITAEPKTGIKPKFTYRVLEIPKSLDPTPTPTPTPSPEPTPEPTPEPSSSNTGIWIAVTVILVVLIGLLLFLLWRKQKKANIIIEETNKYKPLVVN